MSTPASTFFFGPFVATSDAPDGKTKESFRRDARLARFPFFVPGLYIVVSEPRAEAAYAHGLVTKDQTKTPPAGHAEIGAGVVSNFEADR